MRIWKTFALAALLASAPAFSTTTFAQGAAPATGAAKIGVVDIGFIFKNHPTMKTQIEGIDAQIKSAEDEINARREVVLKEIEKLKNFREESQEYKQLEERIAKLEADLKLEFMRKEKEFAESKAKIIFDAYQNVQGSVKAIAEHYGFDVVMRYSQEEMDYKRPATVSGGINRDIVYFKQSIDLTGTVMQMLQPQGATQAAQPAAQSAQAPGAAPRR